MNKAGDYNRAFTWLKCTLTKNDNNGQDEPSYADNGTLWGSMKQLSAQQLLAFGMQNSQTNLEIHLNQWPDVSEKDRLRDTKFNDLIIIDGLYKSDDNETILFAHTIREVT